jgi:hypothetical protein
VKGGAALFPLVLSACSGISIAADFEGGSFGPVEKLSDTRFRSRLPGQSDQDGRNRQVTWYYFRLDGAKGREVAITLADLRGEYDFRPGGIGITDQSPPVVSSDRRTWKHLEPAPSHDKEKAETAFRITPEADRVWIAHIEPYLLSRLEGFLGEIRGHPHLREEVVGKTVQGRDLKLLTITDPEAAEAGKRVVWLMCRQHAWESGTSFVGEGAVRFMLSAGAGELRKRVVFKVFPMMDPDGVVHGGVRFNRNGYDVNRNWDTADPADAESRRLMPEICAAKKALLDWVGAGKRLDLFLTLHNQERGGWLSGSEKHKALADRFFAALVEKASFNPSDKAPRPERAKPARGRATVYQYLEGERGLPAFIMEQGIAFDSKLGRLPTSADRLEFGARLARVMCEVVWVK